MDGGRRRQRHVPKAHASADADEIVARHPDRSTLLFRQLQLKQLVELLGGAVGHVAPLRDLLVARPCASRDSRMYSPAPDEGQLIGRGFRATRGFTRGSDGGVDGFTYRLLQDLAAQKIA